MTEIRRILDSAPTDAERRVLRSAELDIPPSSGRARTLAVLGVAAAITTTAGTGGAAAGAITVGTLVKCIAVGAVGGAVAFGATRAIPPLMPGHSSKSPTTAAGPPALNEATRALAVSSSLVYGAPDPIPAVAVGETQDEAPLPKERVSPTPSETSSHALVAPRAPSPAPPAEATLAGEVSALDVARRALVANDPERALRDLDAYSREFDNPRLGPEATVLRIEAFIAQGRWEQARSLGSALLTSNPDAPYAKRVESLLAKQPR